MKRNRKEVITKVEKKELFTWRRKVHLRVGKPGYITRNDYKVIGKYPKLVKPSLSIEHSKTIFLDDGREVPVSNIAYVEETKPLKSELVILIYKEVGFWRHKDIEIVHTGVKCPLLKGDE